MRARLELFARRWWTGDLGAGGRLLSVLLAPLSWAWRGIAASRAALVGTTQVDGLVVVSVGNLAVGGTGKTPLVAFVGATLRAAGATPAVLVGHRGRDEAMLHRRKLPDVPVIVGRDRVRGARRALSEGADIAVLDDGFQHLRLHRDLDVVLLAVEDSFPGPVLPRGPYREVPRALQRADVVLVTRRAGSPSECRELAARVEELFPGKVLGAVHLAPGPWADLAGGAIEGPSGDVLVACGVARPLTVRSTVAGLLDGLAELVAFADHHEYTPADVRRLIERAGGRPIVITEKDAVKLGAHRAALGEVRVLTEEVRWDWGEDAFVSRLHALLSPDDRS